LDIYKITLKDGRTVEASGNHLWKVWRNYSHCYKTLTTEEMMKDFAKKRKASTRNPKGIEYNYKIPNHKGVDFGNQNVPVDPYTMGLLLGDGSFRTYELRNSFYYTSSEEDMITYKSIIPYPIRKMKNYLQYYIDFPNARGVLEDLGLYMTKSENKFIPDCYIFNSREVRLNILKGIMDSDGFVDSNGIPIIGVTSKRLADNITFLARSLGYNCLQSVKPSGYKTKDGEYKKCLDSHIVRIFTNDKIFNLKRKYTLLTKFESNYSRSNRDWSTIVNIEWSHKEKCKCVTVDNESSCYLIGDFITTHNSKSLSMAAIMARNFVMGESKDVSKNVKSMATAY
jgi:replicative DNA helicase